MKKIIILLTIALIGIPSTTSSQKPHFNSSKNCLEQIHEHNLVRNHQPIKLHLGCGRIRFPGYINIDFAPDHHTVQTEQGADIFGDITKLKFPSESLDEIRSHHMFEHFDRQTSLALLCKWFEWLKVGGTLVIETPDFDASVKLFLRPDLSFEHKQVIIRHLYGSHEAGWALHYDGWYKEKFEYVLKRLGFENIKFEYYRSSKICNIIVRATKVKSVDPKTVQQEAKQILNNSRVNNAASELRMWNEWCRQFDCAIAKMDNH